MTSNDFIDQLERELRAAGQRRVRLELARVPRLPAGVGVLVVAAVIAAAVAVPVLAAHSGSPARRPGGSRSASSVVVGCGHAVSGQLPADWRSARAGTVITGPIAWIFLSKDAPHAVIKHTQLLEALAVVNPGHDVTVSVPRSSAPRELSLDYTDVSPRARFRLSQGASSVTFRPCSGPVGQRQFLGGFIVSRAQCAVIEVHVARSNRATVYFFPLGRSCGAEPPTRRALNGDGIGDVKFGASLTNVTRELDTLVGRKPTRMSRGKPGGCSGINREVDWPGLAAYFQNRRFVGYSYFGAARNLGAAPNRTASGPVLATAQGLRVGDTIGQGKRLYGAAFHLSYAQGGSYMVHTKAGRIAGFLSDILHPKSKVLSIEAGYVGCPAMSP